MKVQIPTFIEQAAIVQQPVCMSKVECRYMF